MLHRHLLFPTAFHAFLCPAVWMASDVLADDFAVPDYDYKCVNACEEKGTFCGRDLKCHTYSCDNWYMFAHPIFTGYQTNQSQPNLDCKILQGNDQDRSFLTENHVCKDRNLPAAVSFALDPCQTSSALYCAHDMNRQITALMNRKCTSTPSDEYGFVCYDMAPDTDFEKYFEDYIVATDDLDVSSALPCSGTNETKVENHHYTAYISSPLYGASHGFSTTVFNATLVGRTIVSKLLEINLEYELFSIQLCENGCRDTEFCGEDGTCHEFNCMSLYQYGPETVTGHEYQDQSTPSLVCSNEPPTIDPSNPCLSGSASRNTDISNNVTIASPWPLLINYHCSRLEESVDGSSVFQSFSQSDQCAYGYLDGRYVATNRHCSAQPNPYQTFSCYDLDPSSIASGVERYLDQYVNKTMLDSECTMDNFPYQEPVPENFTVSYPGYHSYGTCIDTDSLTDCTLVDGRVEGNLTSLDYERLRAVMFSSLSGELPDTTSPSLSPPSTSSAAVVAKHGCVLGTAIVVSVLGLAFGWIGR
jgi:hypothetical protein